MTHVKAFIAGFVSTLAFHQGVIALFYMLGAFPRAPFSMAATHPFGVPQVISLAFFGGLWGIALWPLIRGASGAQHWLRALILGAVGPTAVAFLIVFPMKDMAFAAGWDPKMWIGGFIVNGAWGIGLALIMRALNRSL
jgi:hypothetical protein